MFVKEREVGVCVCEGGEREKLCVRKRGKGEKSL